MRSLLAYGAALLLIVGVALARTRFDSSPQADGPRPVAAPSAGAAPSGSAVVPATGSAERGWVGILVANRSVDVSTRYASLVRVAGGRAGDTVKQGAVLATLEARDRAGALRAAVAAHKGQAGRAARSKRMREAALISAEEAESAQFEAERQSAELDLARVFVDDAIVRAPFDGTIVARLVEPGMHVAAGTPMFRMIDTGGARLRFGVPVAVADGMAPGISVRFENPTIPAGSPSHSAKARVTSISPEVDRSAGLVVIEAEVPESGAFRSGTQVTVFRDGEAPRLVGAP